MHRKPLLTLLDRYSERYPDEATTAARFRAFVQQEPECFERSLRRGHLTGSAWILNATGSHALLTHHKKLDQWLQLGGHADGDPDVYRVALREAEEESGLEGFRSVLSDIFDIDIHLIPARGTEPEHYHYDVRFLLQTTGSETFAVSDESHALAWVSDTEMPQYTREPSMLRMTQKWVSLRGQIDALKCCG